MKNTTQFLKRILVLPILFILGLIYITGTLISWAITKNTENAISDSCDEIADKITNWAEMGVYGI